MIMIKMNSEAKIAVILLCVKKKKHIIWVSIYLARSANWGALFF